jgi:hypothetical protein
MINVRKVRELRIADIDTKVEHSLERRWETELPIDWTAADATDVRRSETLVLMFVTGTGEELDDVDDADDEVDQ